MTDSVRPPDPDVSADRAVRADRAAGPAPGRTGRPLHPWVAAGLVYLSSGVVLVLEILALRLIAPYVGVTLETNTAVIGIALTAIALGAWFGGRLADAVDPRPLLAPILLAAAVAVFLVLPTIRFAGSVLRGQDAIGVLGLAATAVVVPAALLSAVTPMVVKIQLADLRSTGSVVGRLSGIATLGGITATFGTGFVLVAALRTSIILYGTGTVLAVAALSLLAWQLRARSPRAAGVGGADGTGRRLGRGTLALVLLLPVTALVMAAAPQPCQVETAYHCARVIPDPDRPGGRLLLLDTLRHSYVDLDDPTHLEFAYVQVIASAADVLRPAGDPVSALHLGGGGLTLPGYLRATRPGSGQLVYELDAGVLALDRAELGASTGRDLEVRVADARLGVADEPGGGRDLVVGDAFGGLAVPWHLTTRELVSGVARSLRPDGIYAVNIIDYPPGALVRAEIATLRAVFPQVAVIAPRAALDGAAGGNFVVLASRSALPLDAVAARLAERGNDWVVATVEETADFAGDAPVLTDDYAPADQLLTPFT